MAQIVEVLQALQGTDNDARTQAEKRYEDMVKENAGATAGLLVQAAASAALAETVRTSGAVMLRQLLNRQSGAVYKESLDAAGRAGLRNAVLAAFEADATPVQKHLGQVLVAVGGICNEDENGIVAAWPELLPALFRLVQTSHKAGVLAVLKDLADELATKLLAEPSLAQVLEVCAKDADPNARKELALLVGEYVQHSKPKHWAPLQPYALYMVEQACALAATKAEDAEEILSKINDTAEEAPQFFSAHVPALLKSLGTIGATDTLPNNVRRVAVDVLCTLGQQKHGKFIANCPGYVEGIVELCIKFSLDIDDDLEEWLGEDDSDDDTERLHGFGKESLDLFVRNVGGDNVLPLVYPRIGALLSHAQSSSTWQPLAAAIGHMARLAEYIEDKDRKSVV